LWKTIPENKQQAKRFVVIFGHYSIFSVIFNRCF